MMKRPSRVPRTSPERARILRCADKVFVQGNVVNPGTNELILPAYKQTWANIRKLTTAPDAVKRLTFKDQQYKASLAEPDHLLRPGNQTRPPRFAATESDGRSCILLRAQDLPRSPTNVASRSTSSC